MPPDVLFCMYSQAGGMGQGGGGGGDLEDGVSGDLTGGWSRKGDTALQKTC